MTIQSVCGTWTLAWPWPRAIFLNHYILAIAPADWSVCQGGAATSNTLVLFEMSFLYDSWKAYPVCELGEVAEITSIEVADFSQYYVLSVSRTDGNHFTGRVFTRDVTADVGVTAVSQLSSADVPGFVACCNFKGQLVVGGIFSSINYSGDAEWENLGRAHVAWSGIGNLTFRPDVDPTAGFARMWWSRGDLGKVFAVKRIKDRVMVFGDIGLCSLKPFGSPSVGFSPEYIKGSGITWATHVAGDENVLLFLNAESELCVTQDGEKIEILGYKEFMLGMTNEDIIITHLPQRQRFYISDGVKGYCLTEHGLYSTNQCVSSVGLVNGQLMGFFEDSEDYELRLETNTLDFKQRGKKTLQVVEVGAEYVNSTNVLELAVKYKNAYNSSTFTSAGYRRLNPNGFVFPLVTADEMRIVLRGGNYRNAVANLSYLKGRIKLSDKRSVRGLYDANKVSS